MAERIVELLPRLRRFALTLTRREHDADDLVQGTVERALGRLDSWKPDTRLDSWLFKIMQNHWIDQVRAQRLRGASEGLDAADEVAGSDGRHVTGVRRELQATLEAVLRLPEEQRAVVGLVLVEGLAYREAAEILAVPIGTVMSRLSRARAALELALEGAPEPRS
ncbi:MAG: sigma-70 family RNA polymerase sigma factor [Phenylobacterium sp.]|nr:sigma-70 family RNA polymerase sigma factor [Phenylobacterium sp.]